MSTENDTVNDTVKSVDEASADSEVKVLLQSLLDDSSNLQSMYKNWNLTLKKLAKEMEREQKKLAKQKPKRKVTQKPQLVSPEMQTFMKKHVTDVEPSDSYTRQVMMKAVSSYIKAKDLQNPENKKQWKKDKVLTPLFKLEQDWYTFMQINGLLSRVVIKV